MQTTAYSVDSTHTALQTSDLIHSLEGALQLRHLRYFIAVAEEGSVIRAAHRLHVAQPSISRQIMDLEREVGCKLFDRLARGVKVTAAGSAFLAEARKSVESAARAVSIARTVDEPASIAIGLPRMVLNPPIVAAILGEFKLQSPDCKVHVRLLGDKQQREMLLNGSIHAAVDWVMGNPGGDFESLSLMDSTMDGVLLPLGHPLADEPCISLSDLQPLTRLHRSRRSGSRMFHALRRALLNRGLDPARHRSTPMDVGSVVPLIVAGDAYVVCGRAAAAFYLAANPSIVFRPFREEPIPAFLTLYWRHGDDSVGVRSLERIARGMGRVVSQTAASLPPQL